MLAEVKGLLTGPLPGEVVMGHDDVGTTTRLVTALVHDLRNPVSAISAGAELLLDSDHPSAQARRLASSIYQASRRVEQLCQDLVEIFRGKLEPSQFCTLSDLIQNTLDQLVNRPTLQDVWIETSIPCDIDLYLPRRRMERVFLNLMNNSLDSMPKGGNLRISARVEGTNVVVEVQDTGTGVPEQVRAHLFLPFMTVGKENGLGLGLVVSRQTLLEYGGDLWLADKPAPGACFCLRLPLLRAPNA